MKPKKGEPNKKRIKMDNTIIIKDAIRQFEKENHCVIKLNEDWVKICNNALNKLISQRKE